MDAKVLVVGKQLAIFFKCSKKSPSLSVMKLEIIMKQKQLYCYQQNDLF